MVEGYFPGSRVPITPPAGPPDLLKIPEGKKFSIGGKDIELLTISQLAEALGRKPVTIRKWEAEKVIPKATYKKPGANKDVRGSRRLYSKEQVEALVRIAAEEKILHDKNRQVGRTQFTAKVFQAFRELAGTA